jgi:hypothetical protein
LLEVSEAYCLSIMYPEEFPYFLKYKKKKLKSVKFLKFTCYYISKYIAKVPFFEIRDQGFLNNLYIVLIRIYEICDSDILSRFFNRKASLHFASLMIKCFWSNLFVFLGLSWVILSYKSRFMNLYYSKSQYLNKA